MSYQDRLQRYEQEKKKLQQQNLSPEDYMRAIIKLANKWRVQLWKSVVKIVCIMTQIEQTNRVVVVLVGVILKVIFWNYRIYRKSIICEVLKMLNFIIGLIIGAVLGFGVFAIVSANGRDNDE